MADAAPPLLPPHTRLGRAARPQALAPGRAQPGREPVLHRRAHACCAPAHADDDAGRLARVAPRRGLEGPSVRQALGREAAVMAWEDGMNRQGVGLLVSGGLLLVILASGLCVIVYLQRAARKGTAALATDPEPQVRSCTVS